MAHFETAALHIPAQAAPAPDVWFEADTGRVRASSPMLDAMLHRVMRMFHLTFLYEGSASKLISQARKILREAEAAGHGTRVEDYLDALLARNDGDMWEAYWNEGFPSILLFKAYMALKAERAAESDV